MKNKTTLVISCTSWCKIEQIAAEQNQPMIKIIDDICDEIAQGLYDDMLTKHTDNKRINVHKDKYESAKNHIGQGNLSSLVNRAIAEY